MEGPDGPRVEAGGLDRADSSTGLDEDVTGLAAAAGVLDATEHHADAAVVDEEEDA